MNNLTLKERLIISSVLTGIAFIVCLFFKSDSWIYFGAASFIYQIIDHTIAYFRSKNLKK